MYCEENLQHLGPRHEALSNLTWYESLLIARVHPVISVVTLLSTGMLCYAGHVCNYYLKVLEWFKGLPAVLRDKKWFLVKRRRSIHACGSDTRHKKPTTANRLRLEAGIREAMLRMPNVYRDSRIDPALLATFPLHAEQEMLEESCPPDLSGEVAVARELFCVWLDAGSRSPTAYPCAVSLMRYAVDKQGVEMRGSVAGDTAWELCCRVLEQPVHAMALGSRQLSQLLLYLIEESEIPSDARADILQGMLEDLSHRGKTIQTAPDEQTMTSRWIKQRVHGELEAAQESWMRTYDGLPVDIEVEFDMHEGEPMSVAAETEKAGGLS